MLKLAGISAFAGACLLVFVPTAAAHRYGHVGWLPPPGAPQPSERSGYYNNLARTAQDRYPSAWSPRPSVPAVVRSGTQHSIARMLQAFAARPTVKAEEALNSGNWELHLEPIGPTKYKFSYWWTGLRSIYQGNASWHVGVPRQFRGVVEHTAPDHVQLKDVEGWFPGDPGPDRTEKIPTR